MGTLYIVATPIGNLGDITLRAIETLKTVDVIFAEDTRHTKKLLAHFNISKPLLRYDDNVHDAVAPKIAERLARGENIALTTDAGTPGIADPGARLITSVLVRCYGVKVVPIPGPSALTSALSASGIIASQFTFLGYPPHKKGRKAFFEKLKTIEVYPIVLYESPHRLQKTFENLSGVFGADRNIVVASELTKIHEEIWPQGGKRGTVAEAREYFVDAKGKGEFVLIIPA